MTIVTTLTDSSEVSADDIRNLYRDRWIRLLMWHAAIQHDRDLRRLSFTGTLHRLRAMIPLMSMIKDQKCGYDLTGNTSGVCPECGETP